MSEAWKARTLDEHLSHAQNGAPAAARARGQDAADVQALADLAVRVHSALAVPGPDESFVAVTEPRLLNRLRPRRTTARRPAVPRAPRQVWAWRPVLAASALVLALLGVGTGAAYASESALPGQALYPLKRGIEQARLALSATPQGDADLLSLFAGRRLGEAQALIAAGLPEQALRALGEYEGNLDALLGVAGGLPEDEVEAALQRIDEQLARHDEILELVGVGLPEQAQGAVERARERSAHGREVIRRLRQGEAPGSGPGVAPPGLSSPDDEDPKGAGPPWGDGEPPGGDAPHGPPPWVTPGPPFPR